MRLRSSRFGLFYGCSRYPRCRATHGAHPNGEPLGIPADEATKALRIAAHEVFDRLWKKGPMTRIKAYSWMQEVLGLSREEAHIGRFNGDTCKRLIQAVWDLKVKKAGNL